MVVVPWTYKLPLIFKLFKSVCPTTFKLDFVVVIPDNIIVPSTGWRSKIWINPEKSLNVCICESPDWLGGTIATLYWFEYDALSTI